MDHKTLNTTEKQNDPHTRQSSHQTTFLIVSWHFEPTGCSSDLSREIRHPVTKEFAMNMCLHVCDGPWQTSWPDGIASVFTPPPSSLPWLHSNEWERAQIVLNAPRGQIMTQLIVELISACEFAKLMVQVRSHWHHWMGWGTTDFQCNAEQSWTWLTVYRTACRKRQLKQLWQFELTDLSLQNPHFSLSVCAVSLIFKGPDFFYTSCYLVCLNETFEKETTWL